jgi:hypothetical protein
LLQQLRREAGPAAAQQSHKTQPVKNVQAESGREPETA